jgi:DNA processing protein
VGWARLTALAAACGDLERAWWWPEAELQALPGWGPSVVRSVLAYRQRWGPQPIARLAGAPRSDLRVVVPGDGAWPDNLHQLERPPLALYWRGRGSLWPWLRHRRAVAVVGTRRPSAHGLAMARRLGVALAEAGWPVVSGLAEGIDGAVHEGCLAAGGAPVAVLGTPLDRVYPRHHVDLQARVADGGLLVTELAPGTPVQAGHFASRNRLQVALAAAVVVVECPAESGALHSARIAWQQGLPLWAVPGDAARQSAIGSNRLLGSGATPLISPPDLLAQLGPGPLARSSAPLSTMPPPSALPPSAVALLEAVGGGASLEQLSLVLNQPMAALAPQLLELELAGLLRADPGLCWSPQWGAASGSA